MESEAGRGRSQPQVATLLAPEQHGSEPHCPLMRLHARFFDKYGMDCKDIFLVTFFSFPWLALSSKYSINHL